MKLKELLEEEEYHDNEALRNEVYNLLKKIEDRCEKTKTITTDIIKELVEITEYFYEHTTDNYTLDVVGEIWSDVSVIVGSGEFEDYTIKIDFNKAEDYIKKANVPNNAKAIMLETIPVGAKGAKEAGEKLKFKSKKLPKKKYKL